MKAMLCVAIVAVTVASSLGHGGGGSDGGSGDSNEEFGGFGWGGSWGSCSCSGRKNPCTSATGTSSMGCQGTNRYVTCSGTTCTQQNCTSPNVWNSTQSACVPCPTGFQISADGSTCVCNQGTQRAGFNRCVTCPKNANVTQYACPCNSGQTVNPLTYTCVACPANSILVDGFCECQSGLYWNAADWACQPCPGTMTTASWGRSRCTCTSPQIFNMYTVQCVTCASPATPDNDGDSCRCPSSQIYDYTTNTCQCPPGFAAIGSTSSCTFVGFSTAAPSSGK